MAIQTPDDVIEATKKWLKKQGMNPPAAVAVRDESKPAWQYELARIRLAISSWYGGLEVDILWLAIWCIVIGYVLFLAFDVTSTFPVSVKWGIASASLFVFGGAFVVLSLWRQKRG